MKLLKFLPAFLALVSMPILSQTADAPLAPTDQAVEILEASSQLRGNGLATRRLLEGGIFSANVRHIQGAETALQHGKITEIWVIREGMAVLSTGGTLVDRQPGAASGDFSGSAISGGDERIIKTGDLVFIPPGVPHGIRETQSIVYLNIRFELRDTD